MKDNPQRLFLPTSLMAVRRILRLLRHATASFLGCIVTVSMLAAPGPAVAAAAQPHFVLASPTIRNGGFIPEANVGKRDNCSGGNQSPPLVWSHPPDGTQSYAVSMADLDARVGVVWLWLMFNIPANDMALPANAAKDATLVPPGIAQADNGFGETGYSGPCPRKGTPPHHYLITVWALNTSHLAFKNGSAAQPVAVFLRRHTLGHASLTARYGQH